MDTPGDLSLLERKCKIRNIIIGVLAFFLLITARFIKNVLYGVCFSPWPIYVACIGLYILFPKYHVIRNAEKSFKLSWGSRKSRWVFLFIWMFACFAFMYNFKPNYTVAQAANMIYSEGYSKIRYTTSTMRDADSENPFVRWMPVFEVSPLEDGTNYVSVSLETGNVIPQRFLSDYLNTT